MAENLGLFTLFCFLNVTICIILKISSVLKLFPKKNMIGKAFLLL